ncbi:hypothetical protein LSH36_549g01002 [Paralvinella palmiformis]|uniref:Uncharacterized protein n=1 Tax=Paralvinella palmiformis TaxID=53620 RepID=A0AAD9MXM2_9ANNE|nr:hypothetical protein LSH36_549g01002 [Paralvinella palmiformis]
MLKVILFVLFLPVPEPITKSKQRRHSKKPSTNHPPRRSATNQSRPSLHKNKHGGAPAPSASGGHRQPIRARRYDIGQVGQPGLYRGWADVQGQGAANDYCRIIGPNPKLSFLSCTLAGSTGPGHHYVSKRGFDIGHPNTWFMRDMDGDGRDDYCRCVGRGLKSTISCMKAGPHGFYGSPQQPGDEYTFIIQSAGPCFQRKVNPFLGI